MRCESLVDGWLLAKLREDGASVEVILDLIFLIEFVHHLHDEVLTDDFEVESLSFFENMLADIHHANQHFTYTLLVHMSDEQIERMWVVIHVGE